MRHKAVSRKFGRQPSHRRALLRNLATSLFIHGRFETTLAKAKALRPIAERLITLAREDKLHARRQAYSYLLDKKAVHTLFTEIGPRYKARNGGYTRVLRTSYRHGDAAQLAMIELVQDSAAAQ